MFIEFSADKIIASSKTHLASIRRYESEIHDHTKKKHLHEDIANLEKFIKEMQSI